MVQRMITMKVMGGLGNQLFQWACAKSLKKRYNYELRYDFSSYKNDGFGRSLELNDIDNLQLCTSESTQEKPRLQVIQDAFNYSLFSKINFSYKDVEYILQGYWQSEKYFSNVSEEVRKELSPSVKIETLDNSVSLHVRRTDYLGIQHIHPVQTVEYYQNAIDEIGPVDKIYVFSDDISWCETNLKFNNMEFVRNNTAIFDMWKMSTCTHNIIANSSFSWWGAWLNNNPNKKVIAPLKWFGDGASYSGRDIIPTSWKRI